MNRSSIEILGGSEGEKVDKIEQINNGRVWRKSGKSVGK